MRWHWTIQQKKITSHQWSSRQKEWGCFSIVLDQQKSAKTSSTNPHLMKTTLTHLVLLLITHSQTMKQALLYKSQKDAVNYINKDLCWGRTKRISDSWTFKGIIMVNDTHKKLIKLLEWLNYKNLRIDLEICQLLKTLSWNTAVPLNLCYDIGFWTRIISSYMRVFHYVSNVCLVVYVEFTQFPYHTEYTFYNIFSHMIGCFVIMILNHIANGPPWLNIALYAKHRYWVIL